MAKVSESLPGVVFFKLTVLAQHSTVKGIHCLCLCECGVIKSIPAARLGSWARTIRSCGCARAKSLAKLSNQVVRGLDSATKQRTFKAWKNMLARTSVSGESKPVKCKDMAPPSRWKEFDNFLADMGECPDGLTLERVDTTLPYCKANCKWASRAEQVRNREYTRFFCKEGRVLMMSELAAELKVSRTGMRYRANHDVNLDGWVEIPYVEYVKRKLA